MICRSAPAYSGPCSNVPSSERPSLIIQLKTASPALVSSYFFAPITNWSNICVFFFFSFSLPPFTDSISLWVTASSLTCPATFQHTLLNYYMPVFPPNSLLPCASEPLLLFPLYGVTFSYPSKPSPGFSGVSSFG